MTEATEASALEAAKQASRETWAAGDFDAIAKLIRVVGDDIVRRMDIKAGDEVLDVACGTGNATIPAAEAGARAVGVDITPKLLEEGRGNAAQAGVEVDWVEGDAEALPFADQSFDVVISTFGCMFAPRHEIAAGELARVLRPRGRMGLCNWTPEGAVGDFFATVGARMPEPPPFASPPPLWGDEAHVRGLFEGTGVDLDFERTTVDIRFDSLEDAIEEYETKFGPIIKAKELGEAEGWWPELRDEMTSVFERNNASGGNDVIFRAEYLVVLGRKAA